MDLNLILIVIGIVTGCYEVIARLVPAVNDWSILGNIIRILLAISNALNNGFKAKK